MLHHREPWGKKVRGHRPFLVAAVAVLAVFGAARAETTPAGKVDPFGDPAVALDPAKSAVHLADLTPTIGAPRAAEKPAPLSERAQKAVDRAAELRLGKRFTEATVELEKALRYEPNHPAVLKALAQTQWDAGDFDRARKRLDELLALQPDDLVGHYLAARLAARRFENATAIGELRTALACATSPETAAFRKLTQFHLAELLATEGYYTAALEAYQAYLADLADVDRAAAASAERAELRRLGPGAAHEGLSRAHAALGDYPAAVAELREAYANRTATMEPGTRLNYAKLLARAGEFDPALTEARAVLKEDIAAVAVLKGIYALHPDQKTSALLDDIGQAIREHPESASKLMPSYVQALEEQGRSADAAEFLTAQLKEHPEQADLAARLFDLHFGAKSWSAAFDVAAGTLAARPDFVADATKMAGMLAAAPDAVAELLTDDRVKAVSTDAAGAFLLATIAAEARQSERAEQLLAAALALKPDFPAARAALAQQYVNNFAWQKVIDLAEAAGAPAADSALEYALGQAYAGLDDFEKGVAHFSAAIRLNRTNEDAMLALATLYGENGAADKAKQQLEALVKAVPASERGRELLFKAYLAESDNRAAAEQLSELRHMGASPTRIARCVAWLEFNPAAPDPARLRKTLEDAIAKNAPDADTLQMIAMSYQAEKNHGQAIEALRRALAIDPRHQSSALLLAEEYARNLDFDQSLELRRQLLVRHPNRATWRYGELELLLVLGRFDDAATGLRALLADKNLNEQARTALRLELIRVFVGTRNYPAATAELETWRSEENAPEELLTWLLATWQEAGREEEVMNLLRRMPEDSTDLASLEGSEGIWKRLRPGDLAEVEQLLLQRVLKNPDDDALLYRLIELLRVEKRYDEALELARSNAGETDGTGIFEYEIYETLVAAGRIDDAVKQLTEMVSGSSNHRRGVDRAEYRGILTNLLMRAGRFEAAEEKLNAWLETAASKEEKLSYLQGLVRCQQETNRLSEAVETLKAINAILPDNTGIHNDLGYTLADLGRDLDHAERLIRDAVADIPRNSAYLDSMGWVLYKKGDFASARVWLTRARFAVDPDLSPRGDGFTRNGEDPTVCDHLADTAWRMGDKDAALKYWKESVRFADERLRDLPERGLDKQVRADVAAKLTAVEAGEEPKVAALGGPPVGGDQGEN